MSRPPAAVAAYAPEMHLALYLMERKRMSVVQASAQVGRSRWWLYDRVKQSRSGHAPEWIAEEWDRIRRTHKRCDLCGDPIPRGDSHQVKEGRLVFEFCCEQHKQNWVEMEE